MEVLNAGLDARVGVLSGREWLLQGKMCQPATPRDCDRENGQQQVTEQFTRQEHAVLFGM